MQRRRGSDWADTARDAMCRRATVARSARQQFASVMDASVCIETTCANAACGSADCQSCDHAPAALNKMRVIVAEIGPEAVVLCPDATDTPCAEPVSGRRTAAHAHVHASASPSAQQTAGGVRPSPSSPAGSALRERFHQTCVALCALFVSRWLQSTSVSVGVVSVGAEQQQRFVWSASDDIELNALESYLQPSGKPVRGFDCVIFDGLHSTDAPSAPPRAEISLVFSFTSAGSASGDVAGSVGRSGGIAIRPDVARVDVCASFGYLAQQCFGRSAGSQRVPWQSITLASPELMTDLLEREAQRWAALERAHPMPAADSADVFLHQAIISAAIRSPQKVCLYGPDGATFTYAELVATATALADELLRLVADTRLAGPAATAAAAAAATASSAPTAEDRTSSSATPNVLLYFDATPCYYAGLLGTLLAGCAYVPLMAPQPAARLASLARSCDALCLVSTRATLDALQAELSHAADDARSRPDEDAAACASLLARLPRLATDRLRAAAGLAAPDPGLLTLAVPPQRTCYVRFTSGSSGAPKAVALSHGAVSRALHAFRTLRLCAPGDRWLSGARWSFDISDWETFALAAGGALVVPSEADRRAGDALTRLCAAHAVRGAVLTPSALQLLLAGGWQRGAVPLTLCVGGELCSVALARRALQTLCARLVHLYGPTEAAIWCAGAQFDAAHPALRADDAPTVFVSPVPVQATDSALSARPPGAAAAAVPSRAGAEPCAGPGLPIGFPLPGHALLVCDEALRPVPMGAVGELCIAGPGLADGYRHDRQQTESRFVRDPFKALLSATAGATAAAASAATTLYARVYRTGDYVRWTAAGLLFCGRRDGQLKVRGQRVEPGEVEAAVLRCGLRCTAAAVALRRDDAAADTAEPTLVCFVVMQPGSVLPPTSTLRSELSKLLPLDLIPTRFVPVEALPLTPHHKLDRQALLQLPLQPSAALTEQVLGSALSVAFVLAVLRRVSGNAALQLDEDFFQAGGTSLQAQAATERFSRALQLSVPMSVFLRRPTATGIFLELARLRSVEGVPHAAPMARRVPLSEGATDSPVVYFLPAAVPSAVVYRELSLYLKAYAYPLVALEPVHDYDSVQAMAADLASLCVENRQRFVLAGWSFGAHVAFCAAQLLQRAGAAPDALVLLDEPAPWPGLFERDGRPLDMQVRRGVRGWQRWSRYPGRQGSHHSQAFAAAITAAVVGAASRRPDYRVPYAQLRGLSLSAAAERVLQRAAADGVIKAQRGPTPFVLREKFSLVQSALAMQAALAQQHERLPPSAALPLPTLLVRASRGLAVPGLPEPFGDDALMGWGHLLSTVQVRTVSNTCHFDMMRGDAAAQVARLMGAFLDDVIGTRPS